MYSSYQLTLKYFRYYFTASSGKGHGIHSPFVYSFVEKVLNKHQTKPEYKKIEKLRREMLKDDRLIGVEDMGAGSSKNQSNRRKIADIARQALKSKKYGRLLARIVDYYQCQTILELGTSLGITTAYLASIPGTHVITVEGAPEVSELAAIHFDWLQLTNIQVVRGNFDDQLGPLLERIPQPDFVFFDGNHRLEPTLRYFGQCLKYADENAIFVFDDIHWSAEMETAWKKIQEDPNVTCTIDLFFLGLVFFRKSFHQKQNFVLRF